MDIRVFDSGDLELCFGSSEMALSDIEKRAEEILKTLSAIHLKLRGFFRWGRGIRGTVSGNALPCPPTTRAWHAPVTVPKEESSSDSSAALHGGQDTPALPAPAVLR